ncbi:hypothetical protein KSP40_PGU000720 [Platanthera guangdongensis]|uniref:Uncharacterized protein n=1 Tax=Platanthera guangdongensis TaxID=2320717 RepID=A0ABR2LN81_9ASPA
MKIKRMLRRLEIFAQKAELPLCEVGRSIGNKDRFDFLSIGMASDVALGCAPHTPNPFLQALLMKPVDILTLHPSQCHSSDQFSVLSVILFRCVENNGRSAQLETQEEGNN